MSDTAGPLVSIGLPVYNGERYLVSCIESVLHQSFEDFRLFISDDTSTDGSAEICREFAARDPRVVYHRNAENAGIAANFQTVFEASQSPYFKWIAQDDGIAPDFLSSCLEALRARPDASLCYSAVDVIDAEGGVLVHDDARLPGAGSDRPSVRFREIALGRFENGRVLFGLLRRDAIRRCLPFRCYSTADVAVLAEMALLGPFVYVPQPLIQFRAHPEQYSQKIYYDRSAVARAWGSKRATRFGLHFWIQVLNYARIVSRSPLGGAERLRCYGHLLAWFGMTRNQVGLAMDLIALIDPRLETALRKAKYRIQGTSRTPAT